VIFGFCLYLCDREDLFSPVPYANLYDNRSGVLSNAVKFQKRDINLAYTQDFLDSPRESPWGTTQREQKAGIEFGLEEYQEIARYCQKKGIEWFASAWDLNSQLRKEN
jgi:sialic acid synthase SpsE